MWNNVDIRYTLMNNPTDKLRQNKSNEFISMTWFEFLYNYDLGASDARVDCLVWDIVWSEIFSFISKSV